MGWRRRDWAWLALVSALVSWAGYVWTSQGRPLGVQLGQLPDYLVAAVAALALVFAYRSAVAAEGQRKAMQDQLDEQAKITTAQLGEISHRQKEHREAQSRLVTFRAGDDGSDGLSGDPSPGVWLWNRSNEPVFNAMVCVTSRRHMNGHGVGQLDPTGSNPVLCPTFVTQAAKDVQADLDSRYPPPSVSEPGLRVTPLVVIDVSLIFTDARGVRWHRTDWNLREVPLDYDHIKAGAWVTENRRFPYP